VYTDVVPVKTISYTTDTFKLDLNNDGINDYMLEMAFTGLHCTCNPNDKGVKRYIEPFNTNEILDSLTSPKVLSLNEIISGSSSTWSNASQQELNHTQWGCLPTVPCAYSTHGTWIPDG